MPEIPIVTTTTTTVPTEPAEAPNVVAYRLSQVEIAVKEGFKAHDKKLTELVGNFASNADLQALDVRVSALEKVRAKDWVLKTLSAAAGAALAILVGALIIGK